MQTVICLGPKACDIGELFEKNSNYITKLIDKEIEGNNCFSLKRQTSPEDYEKHCPDLTDFFSNISDDILFITSGDCDVLSAALRILSYVKNKKIDILYLKSAKKYNINLVDKLAFSVFQEYTRSGIFNRMYILDETNLEEFLGDIPIVDWYENYLSLIYNTYNSINILQNKQAIINSYFPPKNVSRICTLGFYDLDNDSEKMFFNLKNIDDKCYNFVINENSLKTDNKLFKLIKENIKNKVVDNIKISYKIHSTSNEKNYCYVVAHTKFIQEF